MKQFNMFLSTVLMVLYFISTTVHGFVYDDWAKGRPVFQSSVVSGHGPSNCNDNNYTTECKTEDDEFNWWCVKLDFLTDFYIVWLAARVDYGQTGKTTDLEIRLMGEDGVCNQKGAEEARVCYKDTRRDYFYSIFDCNQGGLFQGRYVYVVLKNGILNFGDFQTYGAPDLAVGRPVAVSSISGSGAASNGYDNNIDTNVVTNSGSFEWWCVKLDRIYDFTNFQIYNTVDKSSDIVGFEMRVSVDGACDAETARKAKVCFNDTNSTKDIYSYTAVEESFEGQYVFMVQQNKSLRFSEIKIHGQINLARNRPTGSSSVLPGGFVSSNVVDGNLDTSMRTNVSQVEWICVELDDIYDLKELKIYSTIDSKKSGIKGYDVQFLLDGGCSDSGFQRSTHCSHVTYSSYGAYILGMCKKGVKFSARSIYVAVKTNKGVNVREIQVFGDVASNT